MNYSDRVKETTNITSTAVITLLGKVEKFRRFVEGLSVGATNIPVCVADTVGNFENGLYTLTDANTLTRTSVFSSSNNNNPVTFPAGVKEVFCTVPAEALKRFASSDATVITTVANQSTTSFLVEESGAVRRITVENLLNVIGQGIGELPPLGVSLADGHVISVSPDGVNEYRTTLGALKTYVGGTAPVADTTAPTVPTSLSTSNVTQTSATFNWVASTDDSGGTPTYEVSRDGTAWTNVGTALTYNFDTLVASTQYTFQVRAVDSSANKSAAATISVTTAAVPTDTINPTMSGSITTSNVTDTSLTMAYTAGSDNVGVVGYDVSVDTGTAVWVDNGTNLSYNKTALTASTTYTLRVRAKDAAGLYSNVITGSVTTSAAALKSYTITQYQGPIKSSVTAVDKYGTSGDKTLFTAANTKSATWIFTSSVPPSAVSGWSQSNTEPPAIITETQKTGGTNGAVAMTVGANTSAGSTNNSYLWVVTGSGTSTWYFWIKPSDGPWYCMNSTGMTVTI